MARRKGETEPDTVRVARWRRGLIDDMGPELQQCVRWMHDADPEGLVIVLRSMRRCCVSESIQQGVSLYWRELTSLKRTGQPIAEGSV